MRVIEIYMDKVKPGQYTKIVDVYIDNKYCSIWSYYE